MKLERNRRYITIAVYAFAVLAVTILFYEMLQNIEFLFTWTRKAMGFVQPIIYGCVFAFLLNPLLRMFDDNLLPQLFQKRIRPRTRRTVAMALTYLIALIAVCLFIAIVVPQLISSVAQLANTIPYYYKKLETMYFDTTSYLSGYQAGAEGSEFADMATTLIRQLINSLESMLENFYEYLKALLPALITATTRFTTGVINLILGIIISVYILMDREKLFAQIKKISTALFPENVNVLLYDIALGCNRILSGFVIGKVIDSIIIGILCFLGMVVLSMSEHAALISVLVGVTNVIPYFGPFIGAIPSFFIIFISSPIKGIWFLVFILLLQQFDGNILGPKILGNSIGLSPLWIIFSILFFSGMFGVIGMFIGVPLFAILYMLFKRLTAFLLAKKGRSTNTRDYDSSMNKLIK